MSLQRIGKSATSYLASVGQDLYLLIYFYLVDIDSNAVHRSIDSDTNR